MFCTLRSQANVRDCFFLRRRHVYGSRIMHRFLQWHRALPSAESRRDWWNPFVYNKILLEKNVHWHMKAEYTIRWPFSVPCPTLSIRLDFNVFSRPPSTLRPSLLFSYQARPIERLKLDNNDYFWSCTYYPAQFLLLSSVTGELSLSAQERKAFCIVSSCINYLLLILSVCIPVSWTFSQYRGFDSKSLSVILGFSTHFILSALIVSSTNVPVKAIRTPCGFLRNKNRPMTVCKNWSLDFRWIVKDKFP